MFEVEEFEAPEEIPVPSIWEVIKANISLWIWAAMNSPKFGDIYFGLNQAPVEIFSLNHARFFEIVIVFNFKIRPMYCIPFSIIDDYRDATNKNTDPLWR